MSTSDQDESIESQELDLEALPVNERHFYEWTTIFTSKVAIGSSRAFEATATPRRAIGAKADPPPRRAFGPHMATVNSCTAFGATPSRAEAAVQAPGIRSPVCQRTIRIFRLSTRRPNKRGRG